MRHAIITGTLFSGLLTGLIATFAGCTPVVGGPCTYSDPVNAQVSVEHLDDSHAMVRILSLEGPANAAPGDILALPRPTEDLEPGDQRTVTLRSRLTGSCTPLELKWGYPAATH
ncbi:hypothetical protein [Isoalcanivorax indicus]|uniref:hypothetical protein n=1 Tax=Isoalcanivorax indicus TaxID=2202653 RepID=UPI000DBA5D27|nr:hypothetical protein [Isoalcanivorax indicus]